jgi:cell division protein DivIC
VTLRKVILGVYLAIFAALSATAGLYFVNMREQYGLLKSREAQDQRRLDEIERTLAEQERTLTRLRTDPAYVERVIRRNLGYAKPNEVIFTFPN